MKRRFFGSLVVAATLMGYSSHAQVAAPTPPATDAKPEAPPDAKIEPKDILMRLKPDEFLAIFKELGWTVELSATSDGTPVILGAYTDASSGKAYDFQAGLYRCDGDRGCFDLVFTRSYASDQPVTLQMVNVYNRSQLFGCAYLTSDGKIGLSLSHTIQGGVTRQTVKEIIDWWREVMVKFDSKVMGQ